MGRKIRMAIAGAALLGVLPVAALAADGSFDRKLQVKGPVLLSVVTGAGWIHVQAGPANEVRIVAHVHASGGSADERVRQVVARPPIVQAGNIISVGKKMQVQDVAIDYEITTPRGTDLRAESDAGDIRIVDDGGPVQAKTGSGRIEASGLSDHVSLETGTGDIKASMLSSLDVKAQTGSGSIELKNVQGSLWAHTGTGDVTVSGRPAGGWKLETGTGNVTLDAEGAPYRLDAESGSGDVETGAGFTSSGPDKRHVIGNVGGGGTKVRIYTGSGDIRVR
jgi:hypothetical protein